MPEIFEVLAKYNFWGGNDFNLGLSRNVYLQKIRPFLGNKLIKVIVGQRRVGKSYLLRQLIATLIQQGIPPANTLYLNKEYAAFDKIKSYSDLIQLIDDYKNNYKISGKLYLFLDEVQDIQGWEKAVNSLSQDISADYELFISGSNSTMLSSDLSTYLTGRYICFEILPFSFAEYLRLTHSRRDKAAYLSYLQSGGLPELYNLPAESRSHYLSALRDTIILKDIVARYGIKNVDLLNNLFTFLVENSGHLFSINSIVNDLSSHRIKTNHETVSNYIQYLLQTYLIHEARKYDIKGKSVFSQEKKYYINDLSYKNYLTSGHDRRIGALLENAIYLSCRRQGYQIYTGYIRNHEVDFVLEKADTRQYLQVTYLLADDKVIEREFGNLEKIPDNYEKTVISLDDLSLGNRNGIKHLQAWDFGD